MGIISNYFSLGAFKWKDEERDRTRGMEDARINQEEKGTREDFSDGGCHCVFIFGIISNYFSLGAFKWKDVERDRARGVEDARINQEEKGTREDLGIRWRLCLYFLGLFLIIFL